MNHLPARNIKPYFPCKAIKIVCYSCDWLFKGIIVKLSTSKLLIFLAIGFQNQSRQAKMHYTLNSEIFPRVFVSRNSASAKLSEVSGMRSFSKIKPSRHTLSVTDVGKSCQSREFLTWQICLLTLFVKIKSSRKFLNLQ